MPTPFRFFALIVLKDHHSLDVEYRQLGGPAEKPGYNHPISFARGAHTRKPRRILNDERREFLSYGSPTKQFLISSGMTQGHGLSRHSADDRHRHHSICRDQRGLVSFFDRGPTTGNEAVLVWR